AALASHDGVDKITFTGSTDVGRILVKASAGNLKKVSLELGGKSPNIVFADADIEAALKGVFMGIFFCQGEICSAGSRLFIEAPIYDEFVARLATMAQAMKLGHGLEPAEERGEDRDGWREDEAERIEEGFVGGWVVEFLTGRADDTDGFARDQDAYRTFGGVQLRGEDAAELGVFFRVGAHQGDLRIVLVEAAAFEFLRH